MSEPVREMGSEDRTSTARWLSQVAGRPVQPPRREVVGDLVDSRPFFEAMADLDDLDEVAEHHEQVVVRERDGVALTGEIVVPCGDGPFPLLLHLHGGGFCVGSARSDRKLAHQIAARAGVTVLNLEYGLAPEHPFPWAVEDAVYAARWLTVHGDQYRGLTERIVIEGCSAGAGLAAAAALVLAGDDDGIDHADLAGVSVLPEALVLFFGVLDFTELLVNPGSNIGAAELWAQAYLGNQFTRRLHDTRVSPVEATTLGALPPTYLSCGSADSLLGHTMHMISALAAAGVPTQASILAGIDHGFLKRPATAGVLELERAMAWLRERLGTARPGTDRPNVHVAPAGE